MKKKVYKFDDLVGLKSDKGYYLTIEKVCGVHACGGIRKVGDSEFYKYLSTHTFYGGSSTKYAQKKLDECGFDVELIDYEKQKESKIGIYKEV